MPENFLFGQNEFLIVAFALVLLLLATEIGFRYGRAAADKHESTAKSQHSTLQTVTMGLLALMLAFTFSMSAQRFEARKQLVVEEANAIETVKLRALMLPQPAQDAALKLLRSYVDARLQAYSAGLDKAQIDRISRQTDGLQEQLWAQAIDAAAKIPVLFRLACSRPPSTR